MTKKERDPYSWVSTRFPDVHLMDWRQKQELYIEELDMNWGQACGALKRCWIGFHTSKRKGEDEKTLEYADKINSIQHEMGITETEFEI